MFALASPLAAETVDLVRWPLCRVLLMDDRQYPWLILVPEREGLREIHHLANSDRAILIEEIATASRVLEILFAPVKINVAALGNIVSQLHVHVVARFREDAAWPGPVWGRTPRQPYEPEILTATAARIREALNR